MLNQFQPPNNPFEAGFPLIYSQSATQLCAIDSLRGDLK